MNILANPYMSVVFNALISGGAFLSFVLFIATFALKHPRPSVPYIKLLCFVMGITQLYAWFNLNTMIFTPAWLNYIFVGVNYLIGPAVYFFYKTTVDENFALADHSRLYFLPGIGVSILIPLINLVAPHWMPVDPRQYFMTGTPSFIDGLFTIALIQNAVYYVWLFGKTRSVMQAHDRHAAGARTAFLLFFGVTTFITLYGVFAYAVKDIRHFYADCCILTLLIVTFLVFALRYPGYFLKVKPE